LPDPHTTRFARHVSVAGFGTRGQAAIGGGGARVAFHDAATAADRDGLVVAATFLAAGGIGALDVVGGTDPEHAALAGHGTALSGAAPSDTAPSGSALFGPASYPAIALPAPPPWWPAAPGDATALACYRGAVAATRWMLAAAAAEPLPHALVRDVCAHARAAFPRECCGYLVGPRDAPLDERVACTNLATDPDRYEIGGAELLALVRTFGSPRPARVVYHSHPNGRAYLSERDRAAAATTAGPIYPVTHLVVGVVDGDVRELAQFAWNGSDYAEVARFIAPPAAC
jgi:proteasome lid subunit RPN8/RPN11